MNTQVTPQFRPYVEVINGQIKTTSLKIAEHFNKRHDNVLDKIQKLDCSPEFNALNFKAVEYTDAKGENRPAYEITRDGFTFLAMGFTGKEAAKWKESYINAFNKLAEEVHRPQANQIESFRTKILVCIEKGETTQQVVPYGSCIVNPDDPIAVATFIREFVPSSPQMLSALSSAYITKLMNCQDSAINHLKSSKTAR